MACPRPIRALKVKDPVRQHDVRLTCTSSAAGSTPDALPYITYALRQRELPGYVLVHVWKIDPKPKARRSNYDTDAR